MATALANFPTEVTENVAAVPAPPTTVRVSPIVYPLPPAEGRAELAVRAVTEATVSVAAEPVPPTTVRLSPTVYRLPPALTATAVTGLL